MRIGRLYTKIFLCFLAILLITQLLTFALFIRFPGKYFHERFEQYATGHSTLVKAYLEEKLRSASISPTIKKKVLQDFIMKMGDVYGAVFWVTDSHGTPLFKSFDGPIPDTSKKRLCMQMNEETGAFEIERGFKRGYGLYMCIPIGLPDGEILKLHSVFEPVDTSRFKKGFAVMLLAIGVFVALLVIPVARLITRRLGKLRESAIQFSKGDLSHRTSVCGKDEIAKLGSTFNLMAERLERMIQGGKELTANVSHELRSPLARIRVAEEIMREQLKKGKTAETERHLNNIRHDIDELNALIGRILEFSKLDLHEGSLEKAPLDLSALLAGALKRLNPTIEKKRVTLQAEIPSGVAMMGETKDIESVIANLLGNAVKYVPENGRVSVHLDREPHHLQLSIFNTYGKLKDEELENVFEPFYRVPDVSEGGTGLGLSIAKKIMERHGGFIGAANATNGVEFFVRFTR